jgi:prepilin-type N-terminal cleavage/methylation domain-containing protein
MMPTADKQNTPQSGVTLVELLVVMVILSVVTTMLIMGWIDLQQSSAYVVKATTARGDERDALGRIASELRDAQPTALPTPTPSATAVTHAALISNPKPLSLKFYSVYNQASAYDDATGTGSLHLTCIWLDQPAPNNTDMADAVGYQASKTVLYWRRDTNDNGLDANDPTKVLATNVANCTEAGGPYPLFTYFFDPTGDADAPTATPVAADLPWLWAVQTRLIVDANTKHPPAPVDQTLTMRLRNY